MVIISIIQTVEHTPLHAPAADSAMDILVTNNGSSAGTITFSGYTVGSNTGRCL